ncbi:zinc finger protein 384b isoform X1 [Pygocentrus nattereri]|uniref:zinc finger protein 384b isoform X1 n=1 Tax=Pygocentrus nattereri TaxID=42514 RepID=UPI0018919E8F|nr:zinc finger protein 384b isoform X1 [Pygocentrus nattereri]XP_037392744.1 zinc finger protein 384b isoform X1 [Pygocentrus nattereri]
MMEDSHFNSYFWSPVPGQFENAVFLNKVKEQLGQDKNPAYPHGSTHYPTTAVVAVTGGVAMDSVASGRALKQEQPHQPQSSHSITVLPVPSTGIMTAAGLVTLVSPVSSAPSLIPGHPTTTMITLHTADKKEEAVSCPPIVIPIPSKRGRKKKSTIPLVASATGSDTLMLSHLPGQHHPAEFHDLSTEEGHAGKEKTYRCRMCGLTFCNKSDMQLHSKSHTEVKAHQCPHCSKSFANSSYLAQHSRIHSGAKPYVCSYCQKAFRQLSHLQQHTRNHTESKPHKCPHCSKTFANTSYLAQHVRIHTGVKPYTCSYCQKSFRQLSHLQQHHRIHTGDRPYKCAHPGCEKAFTQLSNLQSHRRQHNKDKPYKCHHCNRGYVDAASLEVHLSTHTVKHAKLYSCGLCNRTYTSQLPCPPAHQETYLMKHMHKHSPDLVPTPPVPAAAQQSHSPGQAAEGASAGGVQNRPERTDAYPPPEGVPCVFDLHQYKPVASADIQYKTVSVADLSPHKDLCTTVETSAIQVEHLNS